VTRANQLAQRGFTLIEMMVVIAIIAIFAAVVFGLTLTTYGGNAENVSDEVASQISMARMRAVSTKRQHEVEIKNGSIAVWQGNTTGMQPATAFPTLVNQVDLPPNVSVWNAQNTANSGSGATPSQNTTLDYIVKINADGTSPTGATVFITDRQQHSKFRVLLYSLTGATYARIGW
jgi:prepilin-type N-terminal cleavage/methylation domain-containing protein